MENNNVRKQFGVLPPKYNFSLNPYPELRFSKFPDCQNKTGQRTLPLLIHVEPKDFIALNYTNRYCVKAIKICACQWLVGFQRIKILR
jgi:hypothetical protein